MARETAKRSASRQSYEALMARLEEVVDRLEGGNLSLEESLAAFEEGVGLVRAGEARLDEAEKKVELLLAGPEGKPVAEPLEVSAPRASADGAGEGTP